MKLAFVFLKKKFSVFLLNHFNFGGIHFIFISPSFNFDELLPGLWRSFCCAYALWSCLLLLVQVTPTFKGIINVISNRRALLSDINDLQSYPLLVILIDSDKFLQCCCNRNPQALCEEKPQCKIIKFD